MKQIEIERKFLIDHIPEDLVIVKKNQISQGYVSTAPVIRIRQADEHYYLTVKGGGMKVREEFEMTINKEAFDHLSQKLDAPMLQKERWYIPYMAHTIELDIFHGDLEGLIVAEVEFPDEPSSNSFTPPGWFGEDVTMDGRYHNSALVKKGLPK